MMYRKTGKTRVRGWILALLLLTVSAPAAHADITFNLRAAPVNLTMADGVVVPAWGYALVSTDEDGTVTPGDDVVKVPGPTLVVPPAQNRVTVSLTNQLPEETSMHILGQVLSNNSGPVWTEGHTAVTYTGSRPAENYTARVRSFSHETAGSGGVGSYRWDNFRPGTYLLSSGTNPAKQVQMGLVLPIVKDAAAGQAYTGVAYDKQLVMLFHEIDPVIQQAIADGNYGYGKTIPSSSHRSPKYSLINGKSYPDASLNPINASIDPITPGQKILFRFVSACLDTHIPQLLGAYLNAVAEDGNPYDYPRSQYAFELPAGKTMDAIFTATAGRVPIIDARLDVTNAGAATPGGMIAFFGVTDTVTITKAVYNAAGQSLSVWATSNAPGGTAELSVSTSTGGSPADLGLLIYRSNFNEYREVFSGVAAKPDSVTVTSSAGGTATVAVP